jgi:hypothetical protein
MSNICQIIRQFWDDFAIFEKISVNPLTAKVAKLIRRDRKELSHYNLTLRTLHQLSELCG